MVKQLFKKVQKIPISKKLNIFCFYYIIDQFTRYLFFTNIFRMLNIFKIQAYLKVSLIFCIQKKKKIFSEKIILPESKFA